MCSIMWGAWEVGMAAEQRGFLQRLGRAGLGAITPGQGLGVLQTMLSSSSAQACPPFLVCKPDVLKAPAEGANILTDFIVPHCSIGMVMA